ncbi:MAG: hypothetical protein FJ313_06370, partial [Gemmatimonadetes bacterium]|nr:hypothetical protein [Gemmatimonadota bacterium]
MEIQAVRVLGKTGVDAVVAVNGVPVAVTADGSFQHDVTLQPDINTIEVAATDLSGRSAVKQLVVFSISTTSGLPLTVFYPPDGLQLAEPAIQVVGGTRPDAVAGVNGIPADIDALGLFSTTVILEPGPNLIE